MKEKGKPAFDIGDKEDDLPTLSNLREASKFGGKHFYSFYYLLIDE